jgi:hypothetical protein
MNQYVHAVPAFHFCNALPVIFHRLAHGVFCARQNRFPVMVAVVYCYVIFDLRLYAVLPWRI